MQIELRYQETEIGNLTNLAMKVKNITLYRLVIIIRNYMPD